MARDHALRFEQHLREQWTAQLSEAMVRKATYNELRNLVVQFAAATGLPAVSKSC